MADKKYLHNLDLVSVSQLINARKQSVTTAERTALGLTLGLPNESLFVWDNEEDVGYTWDGVQWVADNAVNTQDIINTLTNYFVTRQYFETVDLVANTPYNVQHDLDLVDPKAFVINTIASGSQISVDVDAVDADNLTLTSLIDFTGVSVTVIGAKTTTP